MIFLATPIREDAGASPGGVGVRERPLGKIFETDRENPLHGKKYLKLIMKIRDFLEKYWRRP
jgi:hypothetical protein